MLKVLGMERLVLVNIQPSQTSQPSKTFTYRSPQEPCIEIRSAQLVELPRGLGNLRDLEELHLILCITSRDYIDHCLEALEPEFQSLIWGISMIHSQQKPSSSLQSIATEPTQLKIRPAFIDAGVSMTMIFSFRECQSHFHPFSLLISLQVSHWGYFGPGAENPIAQSQGVPTNCGSCPRPWVSWPNYEIYESMPTCFVDEIEGSWILFSGENQWR